MKDIKVKIEQIVQSLEMYKKVLAKDGDLTIAENKLLGEIIKRVDNKASFVSSYINNKDFIKLLESFKKLEKRFKALPITKMKALDPTETAKMPDLESLITDLEAWQVQYNALGATEKIGLAEAYATVKEYIKDGQLIVNVLDGNQLNAGSQVEYAKVVTANDDAKAKWNSSIDALKAIPVEDRTAEQQENLVEFEARKEVIERFEDDLLALIDKNKVRIDRVAAVTSADGTPVPGANGLALFDPTSKELLLQLDAKGGAGLGAHELLHLVQAKKGKLVFLKNGDQAGMFYDVYDEIDAYKIQFSIQPGSVPGNPKKITDIDANFVKTKINARLYGNLPETKYDFNTTLKDLNAHPQFAGILKNIINDANFPEHKMKHPETGAEVLTWDYYENTSFKDFASEKHVDPAGVKTNAESFIFVIIN